MHHHPLMTTDWSPMPDSMLVLHSSLIVTRARWLIHEGPCLGPDDLGLLHRHTLGNTLSQLLETLRVARWGHDRMSLLHHDWLLILTELWGTDLFLLLIFIKEYILDVGTELIYWLVHWTQEIRSQSDLRSWGWRGRNELRNVLVLEEPRRTDRRGRGRHQVLENLYTGRRLFQMRGVLLSYIILTSLFLKPLFHDGRGRVRHRVTLNSLSRIVNHLDTGRRLVQMRCVLLSVIILPLFTDGRGRRRHQVIYIIARVVNHLDTGQRLVQMRCVLLSSLFLKPLFTDGRGWRRHQVLENLDTRRRLVQMRCVLLSYIILSSLLLKSPFTDGRGRGRHQVKLSIARVVNQLDTPRRLVQIRCDLLCFIISFCLSHLFIV